MTTSINFQEVTLNTIAGKESRGTDFSPAGIRSVGIHADKFITGIEINGEVQGKKGSSSSKLILERDEYINKIEYRVGNKIDYLKFSTSKDNQINGGNSAGGKPGIMCGTIIALSGRSGNRLDALDVLGEFINC